TKSKFNSVGFWLCTMMIIFGVLFFLSAFLPSRTGKEMWVCLIVGPIFSLVFGLQLGTDAKIILIDTLGRTISFTNLITRKRVVKSFGDFDGFIDTFQFSDSGTYRVIYLVNNRKFVRKISSFYYSNVDELQN